MSHSHASTSDADDFALAGPDLASAACAAGLRRVRDLMTAQPTAAALADMVHLTGIARRVTDALDLAAHCIAEADHPAAALEHGRALALMNALRLAVASDGQPATAPEPAQKSGSTG